MNKSLFFEGKGVNGSRIIFNKREVVSVYNDTGGMMYSHVKMTSGEELVVACDFNELRSQLLEVQHDISLSNS